MTLVAGTLPTDANGARGAGGYAPGSGILPIQLGTPTTDTTAGAGSQQSAPQVMQMASGQAVAALDGQKATYSASQLLFTPAATPTDVFTVTGSATKTIRITRIEVTGLATTAGTVDVALVMRSTANTGGTSTGSPSAIPHDSASAAASATVLAYTANPTLGTAIGTAATGLIRSQRAFLNVAATGLSEHINFDFGNRPSQAVVLRGVAQVLAINLNGDTLPAGTKLSCTIEWTEE